MSAPGFRRLLLLSILIVAVSTQAVMLLGAGFLQMGPEFGYGPAGLGAFTSLWFLTAAVSSAPLGRVVERIGWQRAMRVNAISSAVVLVAIAWFARSTAVLAVLLVAGGIVYGLANPAANQALADHVDPRRRALVFGIKHAGIPTSTLLAGIAVPLVILNFGWRTAYIVSAGLVVATIALIPKHPLPASTRREAVDPRRVVAPMRPQLLVALAMTSSFATWAALALSTYLVAFAVEVGFTESAAGWLLFAGSISSLTARVAVGAYTDRIGGKGFGAYAALTAVGAIVLALVTVSSGWWFALLVLAAFATGWGWPGLATYVVVNANHETAASSSGITQAGVFVGAGIGPIVLGWLIAVWSFDVAYLLVAFTSALAAAGVIVVGRKALAVPVTP